VSISSDKKRNDVERRGSGPANVEKSSATQRSLPAIHCSSQQVWYAIIIIPSSVAAGEIYGARALTRGERVSQPRGGGGGPG